MTNLAFNGSAQVSQTRASLTKRIGEIIEDIIGIDRVRKLFDDAGKHPDEYEGKPTGLIALELKVITPETKTALLVAQAAERAYTLAEKTAAVISQQDEAVKSNIKLDAKDVVAFDDAIFKFVGSERDPALLQRAQGTWMTAQLLLNNEIKVVDDAILSPGDKANVSSVGIDAIAGFKQSAVDLYAEAGKILEAQGHTGAAAKFAAVSTDLAGTVGKVGISPSDVAQQLHWDHNVGSKQLQAYLDILTKLEKLTKPQEQAPAAATPVLKPAV